MTEYGGMSETLTVMSTFTGQASYLRHAVSSQHCWD